MSGNINFNFDNKSIFKAGMGQPQQEKNAEEEIQQEEGKIQSQEVKTQYSSEEVQEFMDAMGVYAKPYIHKKSAESIDPTKYLSPERIADIEKSMAKFDSKFDEAYNAISAEFGDKMSENAKQLLALHSLS